MNNRIFREKSLERIQSPEDMNDYIRVCRPGVWFLLIGVLALLIGFVVWGFVGHAQITIPAEAYADGNKAVCSAKITDDVGDLEGSTVRIGGVEGIISACAVTDGGISECEVILASELPAGNYDAEILIDSVRPISFVLN